MHGKLLIVQKKMVITSTPMFVHFFDAIVLAIFITEKQWSH